MKPSDVAIEAEGLSRWFGSRQAVDSLTLTVPRGSVYAFLGRNGSGKTTTIRMLLGFTKPTSGSSRLLGHDSRKLTPAVRGRIGYMAESHPLHEWMTVAQEGWFASQFLGDQWNEKLFQWVIGQFAIKSAAPVAILSAGQRAGLSMALAMAGEPELLVLDDPALGLDPIARRAVLDTMLRVAREDGRTVFFSTHLLGDVEVVADHVALLDRSRLRMAGPIDDLAAAVRHYRIAFAPGRMPASLPPLRGLLSDRRTDHTMLLVVLHPGDDTRAAIASLGAESVVERALSFAEAAMSYLGDEQGQVPRFAHAESAAGIS